MSRYSFVSPGAAAGNAIEQFLMQRALADRQRMLDEINIRNVEADNRRADESQDIMRRTREDAQARQSRIDTQADEDRARTQSREQNTIGIQQMIGDRLQQGPVGPDDARSIAGMAYGSGLQVPGVIAQSMAPPKRTNVQTVDAKGHPIHKAVTEDELAQGVPDYVAPKEPKAPSEEPLVAIMGPDGKPVLVRRSQAEGKTPASTREQGRPVLSSDAGRIADIDTAMANLTALSTDMGKTGASSKIGAALTPNFVTEFTGIGEDAKQRQAAINRVKQIIGKTLEGGVLRKEDEVKYEKILPTIGDPPEVAKAKLAGLQQALTRQREITLESLSNANYDTSKFEHPAPSETPEQRRKRLYDELSH